LVGLAFPQSQGKALTGKRSLQLTAADNAGFRCLEAETQVSGQILLELDQGTEGQAFPGGIPEITKFSVVEAVPGAQGDSYSAEYVPGTGAQYRGAFQEGLEGNPAAGAVAAHFQEGAQEE